MLRRIAELGARLLQRLVELSVHLLVTRAGLVLLRLETDRGVSHLSPFAIAVGLGGGTLRMAAI